MSVTGDSVWVLEAFRGHECVRRWVLTDLKDDTVKEHVGRVPEGLCPVPASLLGYLRQAFGIDVTPEGFDEVVIGREQRG